MEQLLESAGPSTAPRPMMRPSLDDPRSARSCVGGAASAAGSSASTSAPRSVPTSIRKRWPAVVDQLGQHEVVGEPRPWARYPSRRRSRCRPRSAVERDDEESARAGRRRPDRGARSAAARGRGARSRAGRRSGPRETHRAVVSSGSRSNSTPRVRALCTPDTHERGVQQALPRLWSVREAEQRAVIALVQTVGAALLLVAQADRKVRAGVDRLEHDRALADGGPDYVVAAALEGRDELIEVIALERTGHRTHIIPQVLWCDRVVLAGQGADRRRRGGRPGSGAGASRARG